MQTLLGFWCIDVPSCYITRTVMFTFCDDGFGNLVRSPLPIHSINSLDFN